MLRTLLTLSFLLILGLTTELSAQQACCAKMAKTTDCVDKAATTSTSAGNAVAVSTEKAAVKTMACARKAATGETAKMVSTAESTKVKACDPADCKPADCKDPESCDPAKCDLSKCPVKASKTDMTENRTGEKVEVKTVE